MAFRRASRRLAVAVRFTRMPSSKFASEPEDMMPWKMYIASRGREVLMRFERDVASQRSAFIVFAFWGFLALWGIGGGMTSVRMRLYCGSERRRSARSWPMKPAPPVMRMFVIIKKLIEMIPSCVQERYENAFGRRNVRYIK